MKEKKRADARALRLGIAFRLLRALSRRLPAQALALAGEYGRLVGQFGPDPIPEKAVRDILGIPGNSPIGGLLRRLRSVHNRNELFVAIERWEGFARLDPLIEWQNQDVVFDCLKRGNGALLACMHVGATRGGVPALRRLRLEALYMMAGSKIARDSLAGEAGGVAFAATDFPGSRPAVARDALNHLRAGGVVACVIDATQADRLVYVSFFGRRYPAVRGVAALARLSGAPIVPLIVSWSEWGASMRARAHAPIEFPSSTNGDKEEAEWDVLQRVFRVFEDRLRSEPGDLRLGLLEKWESSTPLK